MNLLVADPHPVPRAGTITALEHLVGEGYATGVGTAAEALAALTDSPPDLLVTEIPHHGTRGLEFIRQVTSVHPKVVVVVFSDASELLYAERALRAGARGYVPKSAPVPMLIHAVEKTLRGGLYVSPAATQLMVARRSAAGPAGAATAASLSGREWEVFLLLGQALETPEIARRLQISVSSVESYRVAIKRKLGLIDGQALLRAAVEHALFNPAPRSRTHHDQPAG